MAHVQLPSACHSEGLAEILERVLDKGVVIAGDIRIKLCDIELLTIQIRLLVASVDKAREMGMTWWWQSAEAPQPPHFVPQPSPVPQPQVVEPPQQAALPSPQTPWEQYTHFRQAASSAQEQKGHGYGQSSKKPEVAPARRR